MNFLILIALIVLIYIMYLIRQDLQDHHVRTESMLQRISESVVKSVVSEKDNETLSFLFQTLLFRFRINGGYTPVSINIIKYLF